MQTASIDILRPVFAQIVLMFLVWIWMYYTRLSTMYRKRVNPQDLADDDRFDAHLKEVKNPSDNFINLFEMPVLFMLAALVIFSAGWTDELYISLAWAFVGLRALHSLIHCSYNRIKHRFAAYLFSSIAMWAMWFRIGCQLF